MAKKEDKKKKKKRKGDVAKADKGPLRTKATALLAEQGVPYALHRYEPTDADHFYGREIADSLGLDPARVFETLITIIDGHPGSAVVPTSSMIDVGALVAAVGCDSGVVTDIERAEKLSGYEVTGVSPLGLKHHLPTIVDLTALDYRTIFVSAGRRGYALELSPADLIRLTEARTAPVMRG